MQKIVFWAVFLGILFGAYSGTRYLQMRSGMQNELAGKAIIEKELSEIEVFDLKVSQQNPLNCDIDVNTIGVNPPWWKVAFLNQGKKCVRYLIGLKGTSGKKLNLVADYDGRSDEDRQSVAGGQAVPPGRFSNVVICDGNGKIMGQDQALPEEYIVCR